MSVFKADFFRSFALGFALGSALLVGGMAIEGRFDGRMISPAEAAPALPDQTR